MAYSRLKPFSMARYAIYALFLGLAASVCAEAILSKDTGMLTPGEIEENLQVYSTSIPMVRIFADEEK